MLLEIFTVHHTPAHSKQLRLYQIPSSSRKVTQSSCCQPNELRAWTLNNNRLAQIHKMTMLTLIWYNKICSRPRLTAPRARKGLTQLLAIRCYLSGQDSSGPSALTQSSGKAETAWQHEGTNIESWYFGAIALKHTRLCPLRSEIKYNLAFTWGICLTRLPLPSVALLVSHASKIKKAVGCFS